MRQQERPGLNPLWFAYEWEPITLRVHYIIFNGLTDSVMYSVKARLSGITDTLFIQSFSEDWVCSCCSEFRIIMMEKKMLQKCINWAFHLEISWQLSILNIKSPGIITSTMRKVKANSNCFGCRKQSWVRQFKSHNSSSFLWAALLRCSPNKHTQNIGQQHVSMFSVHKGSLARMRCQRSANCAASEGQGRSALQLQLS